MEKNFHEVAKVLPSVLEVVSGMDAEVIYYLMRIRPNQGVVGTFSPKHSEKIESALFDLGFEFEREKEDKYGTEKRYNYHGLEIYFDVATDPVARLEREKQRIEAELEKLRSEDAS